MNDEALQEMTVTLCGSTRFKSAYIDWYQRLTDQGFIVLTVGRFLPKQDHGSALKADLDQLHFRKIDRSARIFVLDVGGYIGDSTRNEIAHAERTGKTVEYLSQSFPQYVEPPLASTDIGMALESEWKAERESALDACRALVAWDDAEKAGPDYGTLTRDTHPNGEAVWRRWWNDQQALCDHAFATARAFLAKHGDPNG
jgi:hypothetical protein